MKSGASNPSKSSNSKGPSKDGLFFENTVISGRLVPLRW
jgi:hypothetical protein